MISYGNERRVIKETNVRCRFANGKLWSFYVHHTKIFLSTPCMTTDYGLDGPGSNPGWGRDFPPVQTSPGAHPTSFTMGTGSFLGVKCGRGVLLTTHSLLVPRSWKSRAIPLPTLWATQACNRDYFTFTFTPCMKSGNFFQVQNWEYIGFYLRITCEWNSWLEVMLCCIITYVLY